MTNRFKIDIYDSRSFPFGLFFRGRGWVSIKWILLGSFQTRDDAHALYDKIKDLPEYLP